MIVPHLSPTPARTRRLAVFILTLLASVLLLPGGLSPHRVQAGAPETSCTPPVQPVVLLNPTVITTCNEATLRAALAQGGHITFSCGSAPVTIRINSPLVTSATQDIVLDGKGLVTLDGGNSSRILEKPFTPGSEVDKSKGNDLTIQNMSFINAKAPAATTAQDGNARGGAIWATSPGTKLHIINSTFANNRTTSITDEDNQGGAIFAANIYETIIVGSVFENNEAGSGGAFGGIATGLLVYNSRFTNNRAADSSSGGIVRGHGGAIHLDGVTNSFNPLSNKVIDICGSVFDGNTAVRGGGAIKSTISDQMGTKLTVDRSTFTGNRLVGAAPAEGHGGAIYHIEDDLAGGSSEDNIEIRASTFAGNSAYRQGGGVWLSVLGQGRIINSTFTDNRASEAGSNRVGQGGGLIISQGIIEIKNSTFAANFATFQGGAIFACSASPACAVTLTNSLFDRNRLDPTHTNPATSEWQGYHTNRPLQNGGNNLQYPRRKEPDFNNEVNNLITSPPEAIIFADPLLGPLADNNGPTLTMALAAGSPARNAANPTTCPATDQRGAGRLANGQCDIGAYEYVLAISRIQPEWMGLNQGSVILTVYGAGFTSGTKILWNGQPLNQTVFVDSGRLRASITTAGLTPGDVAINVTGSILPDQTLHLVNFLGGVYLPVVLK